MAEAMQELALFGLWHEIPGPKYHHMPGLSHSGAKRLRVSPYHFHKLDEREPGAPRKEPSPQMFAGTLAHCATLEAPQFDLRYVVAPDLNKNSNAYREFTAQSLVNGLEPITQGQRDTAFAQAEALRAVPELGELLKTGEPEVSAWWRDPETDVLCKCRPDWVHPVAFGLGVILVDVKTCADASPRGFAKASADFGYHTQAEWYADGYAKASGLMVHGVVFACVESAYPYAAAAYMFCDADLKRASVRNREARELYARCVASNQWPGYPAGIQVVELPTWAQ